MRLAGHVVRIEEGRRSIKMLTGKSTHEKTLGIPKLRREDDIKMDLQEIGVNTRNLVDRDYWRALVNAALNPRVP